MKITKFEHAHLLVEVEGRRLIIDPGSFSVDIDAAGVDAVVITHAHGDHWTAGHLAMIREVNPEVAIVGPAAVAEAADGDIRVVAAGDRLTVGGFRLEFVGGEHEPIHPELMKTGTNVGVIVDDLLYHPGDSFSLPGRDIGVLAVPIGGPWQSLGKSIDMVRTIGATSAFNLHDAVLSPPGVALAGSILGRFVRDAGGDYKTLGVGDSMMI